MNVVTSLPDFTLEAGDVAKSFDGMLCRRIDKTLRSPGVIGFVDGRMNGVKAFDVLAATTLKTIIYISDLT